ncbi:MAG: menaquinone biosynthesis protein [Spirochaetales bacterium]|nr:menaquinone biosynthesis protein [Spirochaetales bacterium]
MRIGLVSFLNARPLDYGIRKSGAHEITVATPSALVDLLLKGEIDTALISSVECLRHPQLYTCPDVGVASAGPVDSILYFEKPSPAFLSSPPGIIYVDRGSRSSVALIQTLMAQKFGFLPQTISEDPGLIPGRVKERSSAGLLIGDNALAFADSPQSGGFIIKDLGAWWQESEGLPFVYALWAGNQSLDPDFFKDSLTEGLGHIEEIASESSYSKSLQYLKERLHFQLAESDHAGLERFREHLRRWQLL